MPMFNTEYAKIQKTAPLQQKGGFLFPNFSFGFSVLCAICDIAFGFSLISVFFSSTFQSSLVSIFGISARVFAKTLRQFNNCINFI